MTNAINTSVEGADLEDLGDGRFAVRSDLTFEFATSLLSQSKRQFSGHARIYVDMSGVRQSDSAGLALLLEWISWAQHYEREIVYENIPTQLLSIAEISEVTDILASHQ